MTQKELSPLEQSTLRESCVLVDYHGGFYNWKRRDISASRAFSTQVTNSENSYTNYKNIFVGSDAILSSIKSVINEARAFHYASTLPAPKSWGTAAFISNALVPVYRQTMTQFGMKLDSLKLHLKNEWSTTIQNAQKLLGSAAEGTDYPPISEVLDACYINVDFKPVPNAQDITHPTLSFIRQAVEQETIVANDKALTEMWHRLLEAIRAANDNLNRLATKDGRFRVEWLTNLRELLPTLRALNIWHNPEFDKYADEASKLLRYDAAELKQSSAKAAELSKEAQKLFDKLSAIAPKRD